MKKYLSILGLALALSQPVFAQGMQMHSGCPCPIQSCAPACPAPVVVTPVVTGAACPVNTCNPCNTCQTGYACPVACNPCCPEKKGFWARFFGY